MYLRSRSNQIHFILQMPGVDFIGEELSFGATITSYDAAGNQLHIGTFGYRSELRCAYDPNDKLVTPSGVSDNNLTLMEEELIYTIRFQNTGNDTAFNVLITDTLSQHLDWNSFRPITSSHAVNTYLKDDGVVEFHFDDIMLPDSIVNEPRSHGFVIYGIRPNADLPDATPVENTAYIYFDFNPAIVTNTTQNTMVYEIVGINKQPTLPKLQLHPNPAQNQVRVAISLPDGASGKHRLQVHDIYGKLVASHNMPPNGSLTLERKQLPTGVYLLYLIDEQSGKRASRAAKLVFE